MQKLASCEWFRAGTESQIRLLPYASKSEAELSACFSHCYTKPTLHRLPNPKLQSCMRRRSICSAACGASCCFATQPHTWVWHDAHVLGLAFTWGLHL